MDKHQLLPSGRLAKTIAKRFSGRFSKWISGWLAALFLLPACSDKNELARVGSSKLRKTDLQLYTASRASATSSAPSDQLPSAKEHLQALIERTLLAEGAKAEGLQKDPQVKARIRAAEREILAQAYLEKELPASTDEVFLRKEYEKQKDSLKRKQIQVAQIAVQIGEGRDAKHLAQAKINQIYAQLISGADFAELAKAESTDPVSGARGGDLGVLKEGEVDSRFFAAAASLKKDQISQPFATSFGLHIVKAVEDPAMVVPSFAQVRGKLAAQARRQAQAKILEKLRSSVEVKTFSERLGEKQNQ